MSSIVIHESGDLDASSSGGEKEGHTVISIYDPEHCSQAARQCGQVARRTGREVWRWIHRRIVALRRLGTYSTQDWTDSLDDVVKVSLGFGTWALMGITLTSFQSIDGRDTCDAGPDVVRTIYVMGGLSFALLTISSISATTTKWIGKKITENERMKNNIFRIGFILSCIICALGLLLLGVYFSDLFEVRLGVRKCGARWSAAITTFFVSWGALSFTLILVVALVVVFSA